MKAKAAPTQAVLGKLYDDVERVLRFTLCAYHATMSTGASDDLDAIAAVLVEATTELDKVKTQLRDLVEWA